MASLQEYKCPCCGGAIAFNSSVQKMKCPYCDTEFEMSTLAEYDKELSSDEQDKMDWDSDQIPSWQAGEDDNMRVFVCKSCGGQIIADETTAATECPYCNNPVVMMGQVAGDLKPELIIPFKYDKKAAKEHFFEHLKGKTFLPKEFKSMNHIDEIKGIYEPFWLYDSKAHARIRYDCTKVRHYSDSEYDYTETSYYMVFRAGDLAFEHVPVNGSGKMDNTLMESVEPYDYSERTEFQTAYLAGYVADRYDVDAEACEPRANERVQRSTEMAFRRTVTGFDTVEVSNSSIQLYDGRTSYAMYPVWVMNSTYKGEKFVFAMNGQTGKFVGNLPVDKGKATRWLFGIWGIASVVVFGIGTLIHFIH